MLYNILIEFDIPMNVVRLLKMCFSETCNIGNIGKHLYDTFPTQIVLKQGDVLRHYFSTLLYNMPLRRFRKIRWYCN
jgi:hypothetical protein